MDSSSVYEFSEDDDKPLQKDTPLNTLDKFWPAINSQNIILEFESGHLDPKENDPNLKSSKKAKTRFQSLNIDIEGKKQ